MILTEREWNDKRDEFTKELVDQFTAAYQKDLEKIPSIVKTVMRISGYTKTEE